MSQWQMIFAQSRVNDGTYNGDILPTQNWQWPEGTWLQKRLHALRETQTLSLRTRLNDLVIGTRRSALHPVGFRRAA
jgi:hypothetical protein